VELRGMLMSKLPKNAVEYSSSVGGVTSPLLLKSDGAIRGDGVMVTIGNGDLCSHALHVSF
jgi:hypothetical protein